MITAIAITGRNGFAIHLERTSTSSKNHVRTRARIGIGSIVKQGPLVQILAGIGSFVKIDS